MKKGRITPPPLIFLHRHTWKVIPSNHHEWTKWCKTDIQKCFFFIRCLLRPLTKRPSNLAIKTSKMHVKSLSSASQRLWCLITWDKQCLFILPFHKNLSHCNQQYTIPYKISSRTILPNMYLRTYNFFHIVEEPYVICKCSTLPFINLNLFTHNSQYSVCPHL